MNEQQTKMQKAVEYLQNYINTYNEQSGYLDYSDKILIDDMLYGLGVALDSEEYRCADGYRKFKERLRLHLKEEGI